jgi:hypothetical protein
MSAVGQVFAMSWLWSIFGGFYLVAYAFWVPSLFASLVALAAVAGLTLILGLALLYDGFSTAIALQGSPPHKALPLRRLRFFASGGLLLAYLLVYVPPQGRTVAHWPLDLAITLASGAIMIVYGFQNR